MLAMREPGTAHRPAAELVALDEGELECIEGGGLYVVAGVIGFIAGSYIAMKAYEGYDAGLAAGRAARAATAAR